LGRVLTVAVGSDRQVVVALVVALQPDEVVAVTEYVWPKLTLMAGVVSVVVQL